MHFDRARGSSGVRGTDHFATCSQSMISSEPAPDLPFGHASESLEPISTTRLMPGRAPSTPARLDDRCARSAEPTVSWLAQRVHASGTSASSSALRAGRGRVCPRRARPPHSWPRTHRQSPSAPGGPIACGGPRDCERNRRSASVGM
jgi:hypothetical protein